MDRILNFDNLNDELNTWLEDLGLEPVTLPVVNKTTPYRVKISKSELVRLQQRFRSDFELFGFPDLPPEEYYEVA